MNQENRPPATLEQLEAAWEVQEPPFTSPTPVLGPLLAWLRNAWNSVSTKWSVRGVIQQQNEFNRLTVQQFHQVERESQATSARLLAQDHDQSDLVHDVGELTAQLIQLNRQLLAMEERLVKLEQTSGRDEHRD